MCIASEEKRVEDNNNNNNKATAKDALYIHGSANSSRWGIEMWTDGRGGEREKNKNAKERKERSGGERDIPSGQSGHRAGTQEEELHRLGYIK